MGRCITMRQGISSYKGPNGCSIFSQEFYETDLSRGFVRGYSFQVARGFGPVTTALGGMVRQRVPWGAAHRRVFDERFDRMITLAVTGEDLPEPHNRVVLDPQLTDSDGIPAPQVIYTLSENSCKMMAHGVARATEVLQAAGTVEVQVNPLLRRGGCVRQMPRRAEPVYHRRQHSGHRRSGEPHIDDTGAGTVHC